jgi:DNA-binding MarR family transcriptional regulator
VQPTLDDVREMVAALMTVSAGHERARRRIPAASTLALLAVVAARPNVRPSEIATELGLHPSSVSRQLRALAEAGHVLMTVDPDDRRSCYITLTDAGSDEVRRLTEIGLGRFATFVAGWTADEVRTLTRLLCKLEASKAEVARREQGLSGRVWQRKP